MIRRVIRLWLGLGVCCCHSSSTKVVAHHPHVCLIDQSSFLQVHATTTRAGVFITLMEVGAVYIRKKEQIYTVVNSITSNSLTDSRHCRCCYRTGKLWTSPEILRENFPPPRGTQRGDVYSFSVVCFEIMMRTEPYSFDHMTARGMFSLYQLPADSQP